MCVFESVLTYGFGEVREIGEDAMFIWPFY